MRPDMVRITAPGHGLVVTGRIGPNGAIPSGGVGGFESVPRPLRRPEVVWRGTEQLQYTIHLLLDGFKDGTSIEDDCRALEQMGGLDAGDPPPPRLHVEGALPHDFSEAPQNWWGLNDIDWGGPDDVIKNSDGERVRQLCTLTLLLLTEDERLERITPRRKPSARVKFVHAKKGETFEKIAKAELGSKRYGSRLARLNGGRSPEVKLKTGRKVKLPSNEQLAKWKRELKGG